MENINKRPVHDRKDKYLKTKEQLITLIKTTPDMVGSWSNLVLMVPFGNEVSPGKRSRMVCGVSLGTRSHGLPANEVLRTRSQKRQNLLKRFLVTCFKMDNL